MNEFSANNFSQCKECVHYELCDRLSLIDTFEVNGIMKLLLDKVESRELHLFAEFVEKNCEIEYVYNMYYYFKIFLGEKDFQRIINSDMLPLSIIENFIIYLMGYCNDIGEDREFFFDKHLNFLSEEKYVQILTESEFLFRDVDFFVYVLLKLSSKFIDQLLSGSKHIQQVLIDIFLNYPEDRIGNILTRNPVIHDYIIIFLNQNNMKREAELIGTKYSNLIANAKKIHELSRKIEEMNKEDNQNPEKNKGERVLSIVREIKATNNHKETLHILEYNKVLKDDFERVLVRALLFDDDFSNYVSII